MVTTCCVENCGNHVGSHPDLHFYSVPKVLSDTRRKECDRDLSRKRQYAWIARINRDNVWKLYNDGIKNISNLRVCSKHFIQGKPANLHDVNNPDWVPRVDMGTEDGAVLGASNVYGNKHCQQEPAQQQQEPPSIQGYFDATASSASDFMNIQLNFIDAPTTSTAASTVSAADNNVAVTSSETVLSVEHLLSAIQQQEDQTEDHGNQQLQLIGSQVEATENLPAGDSSIQVPDDEEVPESLKQKWICDKCGKVYKSRCAFGEHQHYFHGPGATTSHTCHLCGHTVQRLKNLREHMKLKHNYTGEIRLSDPEEDRKCDQCSRTFRSVLILEHHMKKVHKISRPFKCKGCGKRFCKRQWHDHKKLHPEHYPCYTCAVCEMKFFLSSSYQRHLDQSGHTVDLGGATSGSAESTGVSQRDDGGHDRTGVESMQTDATQHGDENRLLTGDGSSNVAGQDASGSGVKESGCAISCPTCKLKFITYKSYQRHVSLGKCTAVNSIENASEKSRARKLLRSKIWNKVYLCCEIEFETSEYHDHIQSHYVRTDIQHGQKCKKFQCPVCKQIVDSTVLLVHAKKHAGKLVSCELCSYKCYDEKDLRAHTRRHMGLRYQCGFCTRTFGNRKNRNRHQQKHEKPKYKCERCGHKFVGNYGLKRHEKRCRGRASRSREYTSPGSLGHLCNKCLGIYFTRAELLVHQKAGCENDDDDGGEGSQPAMMKLAGEGDEIREVPLESLHTCDKCSLLFENASDYEIHIMYCVLPLSSKIQGVETRIEYIDQDDDVDDEEREEPENGEENSSQVAHTVSSELKGKVISPDGTTNQTDPLLEQGMAGRRLGDGKKLLECDQCEYRCVKRCDMEIHKQSHPGHMWYQCRFCTRRFDATKNLYRHENYHLGVEYACTKCGRKYFDVSWRNSHQQRCTGTGKDVFHAQNSSNNVSPGSLGYFCCKCLGFYFLRSKFEIHQRGVCRESSVERLPAATMIKVAGELGEIKVIPLKSLNMCNLCLQLFTKASDYENHLAACVQRKKQKEQFEADQATISQQSAKLRESIERERERIEKLQCCGEIFSTHKEYCEHIQIHYVRTDEEWGGMPRKKYQCPVCKKIMRSCQLRIHVKRHSAKSHLKHLQRQRQKIVCLEDKLLLCKFCPRKFMSRRSRRMHENLHKGLKFKCAMCSFQFPDKSRRNEHQKKCKGTHTEANKWASSAGSLGYLCNKCFGFYFVKMEFEDHVRDCSAEDIVQTASQTPMVKVADKSEEIQSVPLDSLYTCQTCSLVFENAWRYNIHIQTCDQTRCSKTPQSKARNKVDDNDDPMPYDDVVGDDDDDNDDGGGGCIGDDDDDDDGGDNDDDGGDDNDDDGVGGDGDDNDDDGNGDDNDDDGVGNERNNEPLVKDEERCVQVPQATKYSGTSNADRNLSKRNTIEKIQCCDKIYTRTEYCEHIKIHYVRTDTEKGGRIRKKFECPVCKHIVRSSQLINHAKKHSETKRLEQSKKITPMKDKLLLCKFCPRTFTSRRNKRMHENLHMGVMYKCGMCSFQFPEPGRRNEHQKKCKGTHTEANKWASSAGSLGYLCNRCFGFYFIKIEFEDHVRDCSEEDMIQTTSRRPMIKVADKSGEIKGVPLDSLHTCQMCSLVFENENKYKNHMRICDPTWCSKTQQKEAGNNEDDDEEKEEGDPMPFDDVVVEDDDDDFVDINFSNDDQPENDEKRVAQASQATKYSGTSNADKDLSSSQSTKQKLWSSTPKQKGKDGDYTMVSSDVICCTCNKTTEEIVRRECKFHQMVARFGMEDEDDEDVQMQNTNTPKKLHCNKCQRTTERLLLEHRCTPHFYCKSSGELLTCKMVAHNRRHSSEASKLFLCSYCEQRFPSLSALQFHNQYAHYEVCEIQPTAKDQVKIRGNQQNVQEEGAVQDQGGDDTKKAPNMKGAQQVATTSASHESEEISSTELPESSQIVTVKRLPLSKVGDAQEIIPHTGQLGTFSPRVTLKRLPLSD